MLKKYFCSVMVLLAACLFCTADAYALTGSGTAQNPYYISSAADLQSMANDLDGYYQLTGNINLYGYDFVPVGNSTDGAFTGTLNGAGYTISNLTIVTEDKYAGLFGYLDGTVKDLTLSNAKVSGIRYVGGVAGYTDTAAQISGVNVSGSISATYVSFSIYAGGVVGYLNGAVSGCTSDVVLSGDTYSAEEYFGGIAGAARGATIESCTNESDLNGSYINYAGGIVGYISGSNIINDNINRGVVYATGSFSSSNQDYYSYAGGIVGSVEGDWNEVSGNRNSGSVSASPSYSRSYAGGMVGYIYGSFNTISGNNYGEIISSSSLKYSDYAGGIIGCADGLSCTINGNNYGAVSSSDYAGGIIGYVSGSSHQLSNSCNNGAVFSYDYAGGMIGVVSGSSNLVSNSCNNGEVSSYDYAGGMIGYVSGSSHLVSDSYNNGEVSASGNAGGIIGYVSGSSNLVSNSCNNGEVSASGNAGGIIGYLSGSFHQVSNSCNNGEVSSFRSYAGGMIGYSESSTNQVRSCFNTGAIYASGDAYGIARTATITNCINLGNVYAGSAAYGLGDGTITNSINYAAASTIAGTWANPNYHLVSMNTALESSDGLIPLVTSDCTNATVFNNLDLENTWSMDASVNGGYPTLQNMPETLELNTYILFLEVGESATLTASYQGAAVSGTWGTSDLTKEVTGISYVSVSSAGVVKALTPGSMSVSFETADGKRANCLVVVQQPVTSMSFEEPSVTLRVGDSFSQLPTTGISGVTDDITWASENPAVASVETMYSTVYASMAGTTTITATSTKNAVSAQYTVTVLDPFISSIGIDNTYTAYLGEDFTITPAISPTLYDDTITWESGDASVAIVSQAGVITPVSAGTVTITVTTSQGVSDSAVVTVKEPLATEMALSATQLTLTVGTSEQLVATLLPEANSDTVSYTTSSSTYASVDSTGVITANKVGTATITVKTTSGITKYCYVTVVAAAVPATSISIDQGNAVLTVGQAQQLSASLLPSTATDQTVTWSSSNSDVVSVNSVGAIEAISYGTAQITATASNGLSDHIQVSVVSVLGPTIAIAADAVDASGTVALTFSFENNPGFSAYDFTLVMDDSQAEVVSVENLLPTGTLTSNLEDADRESLQFAWYDTQDVTGDVAFATITIQIKDDVAEDALIDITLENETNGVYNAQSECIAVYFEQIQIWAQSVQAGDVYEDGMVNSNDAAVLARYLAEVETLSARQLVAADIYADDVVDTKDLILLSQVIVGLPLVSPAQEVAAEAAVMMAEEVEPEATAEPEATVEPEATEEPEVTEEPEASAEPEATAEPEEPTAPDLVPDEQVADAAKQEEETTGDASEVDET